MKLTNDQKVDFLLKQFTAHVEKIERTQVERFNRLRLAIGGTFAYYAWLLSTDGKVLTESHIFVVIWIWALPLFINGLGWFGNRHLKETICNHAKIIQRIIDELGEPNRFREEIGDDPHTGQHPTDVYWGAMNLLSIVGIAMGLFKYAM